MRGLFITFEGPDGGGKSTQIRLLNEWLTARGHEVLVTREPGGCKVAEEIRGLILDIRHTSMTPVTEALLYAAARAQHVEEVIAPALEAGKTVICDRFLDSSLAYQGAGRKLGFTTVADMNRHATHGLVPEITFLCRINTELSRLRVWGRSVPDRLESEKTDFQDRVLRGFDELARRYPERIKEIDAGRDIQVVYDEIIGHVRALLERREHGA
ncbi:MAG: dTMP kinase [Clostridiales bacterium]|jgi:dTMP kinase|nr:dTMP kinase [Clostridiales bacterium]